MNEWMFLFSFSVISGVIFFGCLAAWCWAGGHAAWVIVKGKKPSQWIDDPSKPDASYKLYHVYLYKGMAWICSMMWAIILYYRPICNTSVSQACHPVFDNISHLSHVSYLDITAIILELLLFFVLTSLYRWLLWKDQK